MLYVDKNFEYTCYRHEFEFSEPDDSECLTLTTEFNEYQGEVVQWGQKISLSNRGTATALYLTMADTITPQKLRQLADELEQAKIEAEKYRDQIQI